MSKPKTLREIDKVQILQTIRDQLERDLVGALAAQRTTEEGATHEESRPENDKDTRALESTYLARGQARRVAELQEAARLLKQLELREFDEQSALSLSALLAVDDGSDTALYFLAPAGGGMRVTVGGALIRVLTPQSPLGRALIGKCCGDEAPVQTPQGIKDCIIEEVA